MRAAALLLLIPLPLVPLAGCDASPRYSDPFRATGETIAMSGGDASAVAACFTCHGIEGEGDGRLAPRLAGLDAGYLHRQLDDYASGRREHEAMRAIAKKLRAADRWKVASYYAALPPPLSGQRLSAPRSPDDAAARRLWSEGDEGRALAPCAECHGLAGEGMGPGNPSLAGQPAAYLEAQLAAWRDGRRNNDPLGEMRVIAKALTRDEARALAAHAAGLRGARPREAREASRATRRDDPRNDASMPPRHGAESSPQEG